MRKEMLRVNNEPISKREILISFFLFITFAFCKAGALIKGAPITISTVLCAAVVLCMLPELIRYARAYIGISTYYCIYVLFVLLNTILHIGQLPLKGYLYALVVAASPLMYVIGLNIKYDKCMKILCVSGMIVGLYSIAQWLFGLSLTTIPGITLAFGDAWTNKPIGYRVAVLHESTKMPSTTQNGNNVALLAILGIGALLCWYPKEKWRYAKFVSVGLFVTALVLSGSRSACYPYAVLVPFGIYGLVKQYKDLDVKWKKRQLLLCLSFFCVFLIVLLNTPQLTMIRPVGIQEEQQTEQQTEYQTSDLPQETSRLFQSIGTMSGRKIAWQNMWNTLHHNYKLAQKMRVFFIGAAGSDMFMGGEGFPLFVSQYGFVSALLFMGLFLPLLRLFSDYPLFVWSGLAFAGALTVDSSYNYPPILIWFFLLLGVMTSHMRGMKE